MAVPKKIEQNMEVVGRDGAHVGIVEQLKARMKSSWRRTTPTQVARSATFRLPGWSTRRSRYT